ncbi:MAG TPA: hypothetical protein PLC76_02070 [Saprospiraceae bacterium]|jgi:hypothetical protein|nr:MAG: hypothetical protein UZ08_BCD001001024 [Candidatus Parvibacillus calidus]MBK7740822.1 hypothetical protein [Candidatus Parvibacillus calidus]MCC7149091.1 hypothetical protein [Saprospiraceae bacterium]HRN34447.1 hypothetical protein [Saprospiraceae bacterium]HRP83480.1 hypothetical protein [Saprospiraceae bacterium]
MDRAELDAQSVFYEKQSFRQWWIWLILLGVDGIFVVGAILQLFMGRQFGDNPMPDFVLILVCGVILFSSFLFYSIHLETRICWDGIYVRFFPFHFKYKIFYWDTIKKCYVREYAPVKEYGGWGIRNSLNGRKKAYNISGNQGIQLEFSNGKNLLIGTQKVDEVINTLKYLKRWKA